MQHDKGEIHSNWYNYRLSTQTRNPLSKFLDLCPSIVAAQKRLQQLLFAFSCIWNFCNRIRTKWSVSPLCMSRLRSLAFGMCQCCGSNSLDLLHGMHFPPCSGRSEYESRVRFDGHSSVCICPMLFLDFSGSVLFSCVLAISVPFAMNSLKYYLLCSFQ